MQKINSINFNSENRNRKKVAIFIVAYNAAKTLAETIERIPDEIIDYVSEIFVFDDHSADDTYKIGKEYKLSRGLGKLNVYRNPKNLGYGGNQKVGYDYAIKKGYDYVVLLHGDGQYAPEALPKLLEPIFKGEAEVVFGSRMLEKGGARGGGMPLYKYIGNKILSWYENKMLGMNLSEFHSGYRVYSCDVLKKIPYRLNTDNFHFDTEIIIQLKELGIRIKELSIPTYYGNEICYVNGVKYAKDVAISVLKYFLYKRNLMYVNRYDLTPVEYSEKLNDYSSHKIIAGIIEPGKRALDVGCGNGAISRQLAKKGCQVVGVDYFLPKNTEFFEKFIINNLEKLDLEKYFLGKFDYIILADVVEHLKNSERLLRDLRQYLKEGGKIIVSTGNVANWYIRINLLLGRFSYTRRGVLDKSHVHLYTKKSFRDFLLKNKYRIIQTDVTVIPYELVFRFLDKTVFLKIINKLSYFLARIFPGLFAYQFILVAENDLNFIEKNHEKNF